jgi:two-component system phosphate regulon sensor histidine kinase PhoR
VSPISRRIFLYWLLLLVPTLVVGGGATQLMRREQARLTERGAYADEARRAATAARVRLIVENVELLVGDVETGVLDTLAGEPALADLDAFLEQWEKSNPLVRMAFRATAEGRMIRPDARTAGEDARGFLRRYAREFGASPPWNVRAASAAPEHEKREQQRANDEISARQDVSQNIAQVQSARRDVQELFKNQNAASNAPASVRALADANASSDASIRERRSEADRGYATDRSRPSAPSAASSNRYAGVGTESKLMKAAAGATVRAKDATLDRRGWVPIIVDGRMHVIGWVQPGGTGEVRGVELELAALVSRLGAALPTEPGSGEGFALRDAQGRVLHQAGAVPRAGAPTLRVPLATSLLPGWDVVAYMLPTVEGNGTGQGFLSVGVLLVGIFVAAILTGGSLLLWQARRSEVEAAQKTSFVSNVSHEFKTPLTTIRLYAELLEQGRVRDASQGGEYLRTIGRETQRLARLVNNALDFSRLEQGKKKYATEAVDLSAEVTRLLDTHSPRISEAGLTLQRQLPASPVMVKTDRDALEQILLNLIDNACKYAGEGGELTVVVTPRPTGSAEVRVADRGPGVPAEHRERIFEKFHRVDDALTAEKTGAGLGLSIARQLARGLGGELSFKPREGRGAEFILELP